MSYKAQRRPSWRKKLRTRPNRMFVMHLTEISMGGFWEMPPGLPREELLDWLMGRTYRDPEYFTPGSTQEEIDAHLKQRFGWRSYWYYQRFYRDFFRSR